MGVSGRKAKPPNTPFLDSYHELLIRMVQDPTAHAEYYITCLLRSLSKLPSHEGQYARLDTLVSISNYFIEKNCQGNMFDGARLPFSCRYVLCNGNRRDRVSRLRAHTFLDILNVSLGRATTQKYSIFVDWHFRMTA